MADEGQLLNEALGVWPKIAIPSERFLEHLRLHAPSHGWDKVHASDLYLACGVLEQDRVALQGFEDQFMARVPEYILRVRAGRDLVDEVQQALRERLIMGKKIAEYSGKGALGGWLRVAAVRTALNHVRSTQGAHRTEEVDERLSGGADPELSYLKEHAKDLFNDAFKRVLAGLDANERTILRLHYLDGLTMDQLAKLYKTPRSTIARRVNEAREQVLASTESLLKSENRLTPSAVASVIRQARSQVQLTITRVFKD